MKKYAYPIGVLILFSAVFLALPSYFYQSDALQSSAQATRDVFFKIRRATTPPPAQIRDIVLVTIDEESSMRLQARWPWSRKLFASLVDQLNSANPALIGLNVFFSGLENQEDTTTLELADAMKRSQKVVIGSANSSSARLLEPHPLLKDSAAGIGYLEKVIDADFAIRRSYLLRPYKKSGVSSSSSGYAASFPLELLSLYESSKPDFNGETGKLSFKSGADWWLNPDGSYLINYLANDADFQKIPAWQILTDKWNSSDAGGKVILVGLGSSLISDMHPTPFGMMSGIAIHANEFLSLIADRRLQFVRDGFVFFITWLAGLLVLSLYLIKRFWIGLVASVCAFFGLFLGAQVAFGRDLLIEPFILLLGPFFATLFGVLANSFRLLMENKGLENRVILDKMTGLYKYEYLRQCLEEEWKRCQKGKFPVSIAMTDLDRFKKINDTLGHEVGNEMIIRAGNVIKDSARRYDIVSRYGGDEFVILLWHANLEEAKAYRTRLRELYHQMASKLQAELQDSSISIGVACFDPNVNPDYPPDPQRLVEDADKDLFLDKESRRKGPSR